MLVATMIALLFLGSGAGYLASGIDQTHDNIEDRIADENTRKAALEIVERMTDTTKEHGDADNDGEKALLELIQDYETTTAELQTHLAASYDQRVEYQQQMLGLRFELRDVLSREEWNKVFAQADTGE